MDGIKEELDEGDMKESSSPTDEPHSATSMSSIGRDEQGDRPKKARRTFLTQNACNRCRHKKSKCDGKRPACARCEKSGVKCEYEVATEGITRMQNLQQQLNTTSGDYGRLLDLFSAFQSGSDHEATTLLARLRLGESIDSLLTIVPSNQASRSRAAIGEFGSGHAMPGARSMSFTAGTQMDGVRPDPFFRNEGVQVRDERRDGFRGPQQQHGSRQPEPRDGLHRTESAHSMSAMDQQQRSAQMAYDNESRSRGAPYYSSADQAPSKSLHPDHMAQAREAGTHGYSNPAAGGRHPYPADNQEDDMQDYQETETQDWAGHPAG